MTKYWRRYSKIFNDLSRPGGKKEKRRKEKKREEIANNGRKMRENSIRSCCCYYCKCIWLFANTHNTLSGKRAKRGVLRPLSADPTRAGRGPTRKNAAERPTAANNRMKTCQGPATSSMSELICRRIEF